VPRRLLIEEKIPAGNGDQAGARVNRIIVAQYPLSLVGMLDVMPVNIEDSASCGIKLLSYCRVRCRLVRNSRSEL